MRRYASQLRSLFTATNRSIRKFENNPKNFSFFFNYFSKELPYLPLILLISMKDILPMAVRDPFYHSSTSDYKSMLRDATNLNQNYLTKRSTRGNKWFVTGPGCIYSLQNRHLSSPVPIFVVVMSQHVYSEDSREEWLKKKNNLEVLFHNNIRSVNSTLWGYIRNIYIPLLQLEGIRFQFLPPDIIMDLTTTSYQKPKFKSMKEMTEYKKEINELGSLKRVFEDTEILSG